MIKWKLEAGLKAGLEASKRMIRLENDLFV